MNKANLTRTLFKEKILELIEFSLEKAGEPTDTFQVLKETGEIWDPPELLAELFIEGRISMWFDPRINNLKVFVAEGQKENESTSRPAK